MTNVMSIPGYQRLVGSMALNQTAYAMAAVVVPLLVFDASGNAAIAGLVSAVATGSMIIFGFVAGAFTDRFSAPSALRFATLTQALAWFSITAMLLLDAFILPIIVLFIVIASALSSFDAPSEQSLIKQLVPTEELATANAIAHGRESAAEILGGPIAGFLYSIKPPLTVLVQGLFHSIAFVLAPRKVSQKLANSELKRETSRESIIQASLGGYRFVFRHHSLKWIVIVAAISNIPMSAFTLVLIFSYRDAGSSAFIIGLISAAFGVGVVVGSFFASRLANVVPLGQLGALALSIFTAALGILAVAHQNPVITIIMLVVAGLPLSSFNTAIGAFTAAVTPESQMGSVTTAATIPGIILMPLGAVLAGSGFQHWGATTTMSVIAGVAFLATLLTAFSPIRKIPLLKHLPASPE